MAASAASFSPPQGFAVLAKFTFLLLLCSFVNALPVFSQQQVAPAPDAVRGAVIVRGQVYLPGGAPLQRSIQLRIQKDDSTQPPDLLFTDSCGRFSFAHAGPSDGYTLTVEADGSNWGATSVSVRVPRDGGAIINIQLQPPQLAFAPGTMVSAQALQAKIPRAAQKRFAAATKLLTRGELHRAMAELERAIDLFPSYSAAQNEIGVQLMHFRDLPHAEEHLRLALDADEASAVVLHNLGLCLQLQHRFSDALPYLEKAVQLRPDLPGSLLVLGFNLVMLGNDAAAEPHLRRAHELGGLSVARCQLLLAQIYTRRKDYVRAAAALEIYLREVPNDPESTSLHATFEKLRAAAPAAR